MSRICARPLRCKMTIKRENKPNIPAARLLLDCRGPGNSSRVDAGARVA